ncbi:MAG: hypothetical protein Q8930_05910 [Bacillota bacterium]|nr:hypothetical protein [Bacillota bacterium]
MKKVLILIAGFIALILFGVCSYNPKNDFYGTYNFEKVSFLSPLSSSTIDYANEKRKGTRYTIEADIFKIEAADHVVEINSPKYVKEEVHVDSSKAPDFSALSGTKALIENKIKYQYTIYNKDGGKTHWRLYYSSKGLWIASYVDNTADGSEIIMELCKLTK